MKYFVDPYKRYYEKLGSAGNLSSQATSICSSIENAKSGISNLSSSVDDSKWSEMGIDELKTNVLPSLLQNHDTLANNVNNVLVKIVNKAIGELLPLLGNLKAEDERLEKLNEELDTLLANPEYEVDSEGNTTSTLTSSYRSELDNKRKEISDCEEKCKKYVKQSDEVVADIKSLDSNVEDFKVDISSLNASSSSGLSVSLGQCVKDGKMIEIEFRGRKFYIANTRINALDYERYVQQYGLTQNAGVLSSECPILSQYYAMDMMRGTYTTKVQMVNFECGPSPRMNDGISTESEDELLEYLYNEATNGRLTTLQVTQRMTEKTENGYRGPRHVVTVIGFDSSVKSSKDLNPDTILVLDCVDGKIQTLSQARSEGGHERDIYKREGFYFAHGATETFLAEEVENDEWYEKYGVKKC